MIRIFLLFFLWNVSLAQSNEATLIFKDGTSVKGFGSIKKNKIQFRASLNDKPDLWDEELVESIVFDPDDTFIKYTFVKPDKMSKYKIMKVITEGEVTLYEHVVVDYFDKDDLFAFSYGPKSSQPEKTNHYLQKKDEEFPTLLKDGFGRIKKYFSDCETLVKKIENNQFYRNDIQQIVEYYNDICAE